MIRSNLLIVLRDLNEEMMFRYDRNRMGTLLQDFVL